MMWNAVVREFSVVVNCWEVLFGSWVKPWMRKWRFCMRR